MAAGSVEATLELWAASLRTVKERIRPLFRQDRTAAAAGLVGLFGQLMSRYRFASALPYMTAAIGPLLPGSATYFGLLAIAQSEVDRGLVSLSTAVALAMAIAIGVNLGGEISRLFLRVPGGAAAHLPVGMHPLDGKLVLASADDVRIEEAEPTATWPTRMTPGPGDMPMIFASKP